MIEQVFSAHFYSASALLAMQTAVIARLFLSVTFWCFAQMNEYTIVRLSASDCTVLLVSGEVTSIWIFSGKTEGIIPQRGR